VTPYRRRIRLDATPGRVAGDLEDDFHHFRVVVHHDGAHVTVCEGEALRFPWTSCASADAPLRAVVGAPLTPRATALRGHTNPRANCTHLFDLTGLALAQAARGAGTRQYDIVVPDRVRGRTSPTIARDGTIVLRWELAGSDIESPDPFTGIGLRGSFIAWAESTLDPETAEAAIVLRRAAEISHGRDFDLDAYERAIDVGPFMAGTCHTYQPGTMETALRVRGSTRSID
jgi:Protein of unknown function (DUF2889)